MKNDYIKQALLLEIERFKIFLTVTAVTFGSLLSLLQNNKTPNYLLALIISLLLMGVGLSVKTHFDIEILIRKYKG
jgi:hypothetical protein